MNRTVMVRVTDGFNPFTVLDDIRSIGFQFDHLLPYGTDGDFMLVGMMNINHILLLKSFDGVKSFKTTEEL